MNNNDNIKIIKENKNEIVGEIEVISEKIFHSKKSESSKRKVKVIIVTPQTIIAEDNGNGIQIPNIGFDNVKPGDEILVGGE